METIHLSIQYCHSSIKFVFMKKVHNFLKASKILSARVSVRLIYASIFRPQTELSQATTWLFTFCLDLILFQLNSSPGLTLFPHPDPWINSFESGHWVCGIFPRSPVIALCGAKNSWLWGGGASSDRAESWSLLENCLHYDRTKTFFKKHFHW